MTDLSTVPTSTQRGIREVSYIARRDRSGLFHIQCPGCKAWLNSGRITVIYVYCYPCEINITIHETK